MTRSRTIVIAGAGIGGLTAALALTRQGFRVVVLEAARELTAVGAGIQLAPNATRILETLGVSPRLAPFAVAPSGVDVRAAPNGRLVTHIGFDRKDAPYWSVHRGDLQRALLETAADNEDIVLRLGVSVADHAQHAHGVTVAATVMGRAVRIMTEESGIALIGADGLWSAVRGSLGHHVKPKSAQRMAWRATIPAAHVDPAWRKAAVTLWLGSNAHLVHYPVRGGDLINVVAIVSDGKSVDPKAGGSWSVPGDAAALQARFATWAPAARDLLAAAPGWQCWPLYEMPQLPYWGRGAATLLGDAAHATLPFLAQGGALAIEDAAELAAQLARHRDDLAGGMRAYEAARRPRTARAVREAARNGRIYHLPGPLGFVRNAVMASLGGERLKKRYDWLYDWRVSRGP
ncbi:MAG: FAD-dependent monooxygenase [Variibacter sp.]